MNCVLCMQAKRISIVSNINDSRCSSQHNSFSRVMSTIRGLHSQKIICSKVGGQQASNNKFNNFRDDRRVKKGR